MRSFRRVLHKRGGGLSWRTLQPGLRGRAWSVQVCYKIARLHLHLNGKKVLLIYRFTPALAPKNADLKLK